MAGFDPNQPRNKDGEWTVAGKAAMIASGLTVPSSLDEMYAGLPSNGGYGSDSEYEIGFGLYTEAAHCIIGSLAKCYHSGFEPGRKMAEEEHIREELGIMKDTIDEYSRDLYTRPDMLGENSRKSISDNGKVLSKLVFKARDNLGNIPQEYKHVAITTLDAIRTLISYSKVSANIFKTRELKAATSQVEEAVNILYSEKR